MYGSGMPHSKFEIFLSPPSGDGSVPREMLDAVSDFVREKGVAPKSVGVEYIEGREEKGDESIVLSLGYRDDEEGHAVNLECVSLGRILSLDKDVIREAMQAAAAARGGVICHEFYVTDEREFFLVLMTRVS